MHIQPTDYTGRTPSVAEAASPVAMPGAGQINSSALVDIQGMLDKISLLFKSLRDQTQDRNVQQRANSFTLMEGKLQKKKEANAAETKAGYMSAGFALGGAVLGGAFGIKGVKNTVASDAANEAAKKATGVAAKEAAMKAAENAAMKASRNTLASQMLPKLSEASGSFAETSVRQNEVNPARLASETIGGYQEIYDKDRARTEDKADEFARQVLKAQEAINTVFREFTSAAMMK